MSQFPLLAGAATPTAPSGVDPGAHIDLKGTAGFLVADVRGRVVGRVERLLYGSSEETPDGLSARFSLLRWRRPAAAVAAIDDRTQVIGLHVERGAIQAFL